MLRLGLCVIGCVWLALLGGCSAVDLPQINPGNRLPAANAGPDQTVPMVATVRLDGSGSTDPDGDSLSYSWIQSYGPAADLQDTQGMYPDFVASALGVYEFVLTVTDGRGGSDSDTVRVTVLADGSGGADSNGGGDSNSGANAPGAGNPSGGGETGGSGEASGGGEAGGGDDSVPRLHYLVASLSHPSGGSILINPLKPLYSEGDKVVLSVLTNAGYEFDHWDGDVTSNENPLTLTMDTCITVRAVLRYWGTSSGPTEVAGGIFSDTIWSASQSPYVVTDDVTVFPDRKLTIEPGTEVRFTYLKGLVVRGFLCADGTSLEPIVLTSGIHERGAWQGLTFQTTQGAGGILRYVSAAYADAAVYEECCWGGAGLLIRDCNFAENRVGVGGYAGDYLLVIDSVFENNDAALADRDKRVYRCDFRSNDFGLYQTKRVNVYGSSFEDNGVALSGGRGIVKFCQIQDNGLGIDGISGGFSVLQSTITANNTGIRVTDYNGFISPIHECNIDYNTKLNVSMLSSYPADMTRNWWGTTVQADLESMIYDGRDDPDLGLVEYWPYENSLQDTDAFYLEVEVLGHGSAGDSISAYAPGTVVQRQAIAEEGYVFSHWEGAATASSSSIELTMDADKKLRAVFIPAP
jgi:hypothetical protein